MENEMFTLVVCTSFSHVVETRYCSRSRADSYFDDLIEGTDDVQFVAYYCASVGGLVNSWHLCPHLGLEG